MHLAALRRADRPLWFRLLPLPHTLKLFLECLPSTCSCSLAALAVQRKDERQIWHCRRNLGTSMLAGKVMTCTMLQQACMPKCSMLAMWQMWTSEQEAYHHI